MYPSIRINCLSLLVSFAGQLRTVVFLPSEDNSNASPLVILSRSITSGSTRAIILHTSRCSASATFNVASFGSFFIVTVMNILIDMIIINIWSHTL
jgi:hypothetical protein